MTKRFRKAPKKLFDRFSSYFPHSTVDVVIRGNASFILAKRAIPPYKNKWNLPGGIVFKTEKLSDAAKRVAKDELNLAVKIEGFLGVYENPMQSRHDISHVFLASVVNGTVTRDFQSSDVRPFKNLPRDMVPYQKKILRDAQVILKKRSMKC
ncbi:MAG: NUDIX hydrolase [Thaumarchaeota archaeon]|nr:NUDIX hydrolase [Nitrososphaerota archaeon]